MALQHQRHDGRNGGYRLVSWDDAFGHAVIWEYDQEDRLERRGVITHHRHGAPDAETEVVWHDADGNEVQREIQVHEFE